MCSIECSQWAKSKSTKTLKHYAVNFVSKPLQSNLTISTITSNFVPKFSPEMSHTMVRYHTRHRHCCWRLLLAKDVWTDSFTSVPIKNNALLFFSVSYVVPIVQYRTGAISKWTGFQLNGTLYQCRWFNLAICFIILAAYNRSLIKMFLHYWSWYNISTHQH